MCIPHAPLLQVYVNTNVGESKLGQIKFPVAHIPRLDANPGTYRPRKFPTLASSDPISAFPVCLLVPFD